MDQFLMWFITKHWIAASVIFPELTLIWALYMRYAQWAVFMALYAAVIRIGPLVKVIRKTWAA